METPAEPQVTYVVSRSAKQDESIVYEATAKTPKPRPRTIVPSKKASSSLVQEKDKSDVQQGKERLNKKLWIDLRAGRWSMVLPDRDKGGKSVAEIKKTTGSREPLR